MKHILYPVVGGVRGQF